MTICEVGFNAGLSSLLLLEAGAHSRVISFDLGDFTWARSAEAWLRANYSASRFLGVVFGDSSRTLPAFKASHADFSCDVMFIDGDKSYEGRRAQLRLMRAMSYPGAHLFFDEITSQQCMNGSVPLEHHSRECRTRDALRLGYWPAMQAYDAATRAGEVKVLQCAWPRAKRYANIDGICEAEFL